MTWFICIIFLNFFGTPELRLFRSRCANYQKVIFQVPVTDRGHTHNDSSMTNLISSVLNTWPASTYPIWLVFFFVILHDGEWRKNRRSILYIYNIRTIRVYTGCAKREIQTYFVDITLEILSIVYVKCAPCIYVCETLLYDVACC